ncbi:MAG: hypothetical protein V8R67_14405 [Eubacterium sp.]
MSVNGIQSSQPTYTSTTTKATEKKTAEKKSTEDTGVVYEPSKNTENTDTSKVNDYQNVIKQMKGELSSKNQQLQNLVDQLLSKQAKKYTTLKDLFTDIKDGKVDVDPATIAQAQKDVADDGYWGVDKTSDRLVDMAKALSGGDSSKADTLIAAIKKGFDQAADAWGGELPEICQKTIDAAVQKLNDWKSGQADA